MVDTTDDFSTWLAQADVPAGRLTPQQQALLRAVFRFRRRQGQDYYSSRLLSHFLLHCDSGLKVAQVARLLGLTRPTASGHQGLSSKQVIQQAHHRLDGRPYGKLLPRYAGPIAQFLLAHPGSSRSDLLDFVQATFGVRVSRIALYKFFKKYGLDHVPGQAPEPAPAGPPQGPAGPGQAGPPADVPASAPAPVAGPAPVPVPIPAAVPAPPFSSPGPSTPARSC
jgi:hypothetical protein